MIAIYRGEDTDFAGAQPYQIKIDTDLDLTGYTADLIFGSITKSFGPEEVGAKLLNLSYTAEETSTFFPGKGFATIKVYDTEGRVAILKKFVIDVRFRRCKGYPIDGVDVAEAVDTVIHLREAATNLNELTEDDDTAAVKEQINTLVGTLKERVEF